MLGVELWYDVFDTRLGWIALVTSCRGVVRTTLPKPNRSLAVSEIFSTVEGLSHDPGKFKVIKHDIRNYFSGKPSDLQGQRLDFSDAPGFFVAVWDVCRRIPFGETRSYSWLARHAGRPSASRAAGQAMARNRFPLLVPCHRVIRSDGSIGGFGGQSGILLKRNLLKIESLMNPLDISSGDIASL